MRFTIPLLLIAAVATPSIADAKAARPAKPAKIVRPARVAPHGSGLAAGAVAPIAAGTVAVAAQGYLLTALVSGGDRATASPTVSPE